MADRHSLAQIEAALRKADGRPAAAARLLGMTRQAMHDRIARTPHLAQLVSDIEQTLLDEAEGVIRRAVRAGDRATIRWYLDRRGQKRGYGKGGRGMAAMPDADVERLVTQLGGSVEICRRTLREQ
jgi:hypothetical protein